MDFFGAIVPKSGSGGDEEHQQCQHFKKQLEISGQELLRDVELFCWSRGLVHLRLPLVGTQLIPVSIFPYPLSRRLFHHATRLTPLFGQLIHASILQMPKLAALLQKSALKTGDDWTCRLCKIIDNVYLSGKRDLTKDPQCVLFRSDYFVDCGSNSTNRPPALKQVELNTIAAAFAAHAPQVRDLHEMVLRKTTHCGKEHTLTHCLPQNPSCTKFAETLAEAALLYKKVYLFGGSSSNAGDEQRLMRAVSSPTSPDTVSTPVASPPAAKSLAAPCPVSSGLCVITVVAAGGKNASDQFVLLEQAGKAWTSKIGRHTSEESSVQPLRFFTFTLADLVRMAMAEHQSKDHLASLVACTSPENKRHPIFLRDPLHNDRFYEVAVVYFRHGFRAAHYESDASWDVREILESSDAICIPSVPAELSGHKKLQSLWNNCELLSQLVKDEEACARVRATFVDSVDPADPNSVNNGHLLLEEGQHYPERFVLKSATEAAKSFTCDVSRVCEEFINNTSASPPAEWGPLILMRRITPEKLPFAKLEKTQSSPHKLSVSADASISELGMYGALVTLGTECLKAEHCGHLVRTKSVHSTSGSVCGEGASLNSPFLVDS